MMPVLFLPNNPKRCMRSPCCGCREHGNEQPALEEVFKVNKQQKSKEKQFCAPEVTAFTAAKGTVTALPKISDSPAT